MFDIIGDVHGCYGELVLLLEKLGYESEDPFLIPYTHPRGRQAVFVGDLVDRGPNSPGVVAIVRQMVKTGTGLCVIGNHDHKLLRYLKGNKVKVGKALADCLNQIDSKNILSKKEIIKFFEKLPYKLLLDSDQLLVCHAGLKEKYHLMEENKIVRAKCLYGETTGKTDLKGFPIRLPWQKDYRGNRIVVHGHTPLEEPSIENRIYSIDTSCCFGGKLTALRYPEMKLMSQKAFSNYWIRGEK